MINFSFSKKLGFFFTQKYLFQFDHFEYLVKVSSNILLAESEFDFWFNKKKIKLRIKAKGVTKTEYKILKDGKTFCLTYYNHRIIINFEDVNYDFEFNNNLIVGIFNSDNNVGIIKQKKYSKLGLEEYKGYFRNDIPKEVILLFLIFFDRSFSKENYLFYVNKGFTNIDSKKEYSSELLKLAENIEF